MNMQARGLSHKSLKNRIWQLPNISSGDVYELMAQGANALTAPILAARGLKPEDVPDFLTPTVKALLPRPSFFNDMDKAADRIAQAIINQEKVAIWTDYDADGATSGATMGRFLRDCGLGFSIYVPDRIKEGYGPNSDGLIKLQNDGHTLIIVLDSGTTAFEPLQTAFDIGLDVVVIDHHNAEDQLPSAVAVVNPNRLDQAPGYGHLCAAGMTFIACIAVSMRLRGINFFNGLNGRPSAPPEFMHYLDLVALGTICDVVPLTTLNRAFVLRGLPYLTERRLPGIAALAQVAGCEDEITEKDCGFTLGPRINASGRIGAANAAVLLLLEQDPEVAMTMAEDLNLLNRERQEMEKLCTKQALEQLSGKFVPGETRQVAIAVTDAHEGVVGITAARLKEAMDAPAFVLTYTPEGELKGSGRGVPGFHLGEAIIKAKKLDILVKGGGHAMAGGITLDPERLTEFTDFMNNEIAQSEYYHTGVVSRADSEIPIHKATFGLIDAAQSLSPFGMGNPTPKFIISAVKVADVVILSGKHIKLVLEDPKLGPAGPRVEAPIWNAVDTPFGDQLKAMKGSIVDCLGSLERNEWKGRSKLQLKVEDVRLH